MRLGIVSSAQDIAGKNIRKKLLERGFCEAGMFEGAPVYEAGNFLLIETKKSLLEVSDLDFDVDAYLFASKHVSKKGKNSLTAHFPGNWNDAKYGGEPESFGAAMPCLLKTALLGLEEQKIEGYEVTMEVTHHGPTSLDKPVLFVEIGSGKKAWNDVDAIDVVAKTLLKRQKGGFKNALGFGGGHYPITLTRLELDTKIAFGHTGAKYAEYNEKNVKNAIEMTLNPVFCVIDKDGLRKNQRQMIEKVARAYGLDILSPIDVIEMK